MSLRRFVSLIAIFGAIAPAQAAADSGTTIAAAARRQIGVTRVYDASYAAIRYPGGDVAKERGVCADVVIRAFRGAGVDLQQEVHRDMQAHFTVYPRIWGLSAPDANIDHRRVLNLMTFFERHGRSVGGEFRAGDVVAWRLPSGQLHIGVIAAERAAGGVRPLVIHNIGYGTQEEDVLYAFAIIGHYRW
ncbi:MAG TPA: DUF1287 domain-containing protein [Thermoanaerobaculia bacterium]|jgi:hypothetical protein|nr:DUF1287 domain-containing protein [Thermoanaerobaculia bacterium]